MPLVSSSSAAAGSPAAAGAAPALVGGSIASYAPCFSNDDKLLCVPCGNGVKLYSVRTGEQVGLLGGAGPGESDASVRADGSHAGHSRTVTAVLAHPSNRVQLYTAALDGTVKLWDLYDQSCVATYAIKIAGEDKFDRPPVLAMVKGAADLLYLLVDPQATTAAPAPASTTPTSPALAPAASPAAATAAVASDRAERSCRIVLYQLSKRTCFILYKVKDAVSLAIDPSLRLLAAISGKTVRIYDTQRTKRSKSTFKKILPYNLSTVTFHPTDPYLTLGDEQGHILIVHGYQQQGQGQGQGGGKAASGAGGDGDLVTQTLHWHAHKVGAVMFTQDGHYMLSGGEEGVLVIWQLETGTKQFIPRLQSNILHLSLSHDGNTYALSMGDNRIKFVSAVSNRVERVIAGLSYSAPSPHSSGVVHTAAPSASASSSAGGAAPVPRSVRVQSDDPSRQLHLPFLYSPLHGGWFLNSILHPGALQLYDLFADRHLMDADLLQRNVLSRTDDPGSGSGGEGGAAPNANQPRIEQAVLHPRGHKMATLERRSGQGAGGVSGVAQSNSGNNDSTILKFWEWNPSSASFVLNTRIEPPHSHATAHQALVGLLWHPSDNMVVTIGRDHCFRIWREIRKPQAPNVRKEALAAAKAKAAAKGKNGAVVAQEEEEEECYWNCTGVGHYRSYPTSGGAFSSDGSLLAVAYGQVLTLWDPYTLTLKHTLLHPSPAHPIRFVSFLPHTPFLLTTTARAIYVWNLLTLSLWWSFDLRVISIAVHQQAMNDKGHFAVMVLQPDENEPEEDEEADDEKDQLPESGATTPAAVAAVANSTTPKPFRRRQTHLLLFSVHSPVPLRAWPLRDARLETVHLPGSSSASSSALAQQGAATGAGSSFAAASTTSFESPILFASDPALQRGAKRPAVGTTGSQSGAQQQSQQVVPTSLVYINYKRQLVRLDDVFGETGGATDASLPVVQGGAVAAAESAAAMARMQAQSEEISLFESLYGKAHRPAPRTPSIGAQAAPAPSSSLPALAPGSSALAALLNAPSHILPPPSSLFTAVMDGLLAKSVQQAAAAAVATHATQAAQQQQLQSGDGDASMEDASSVPVSSLHPSVAALDAALLQSDSVLVTTTSQGAQNALFHWEDHPQLAKHFDALVARMHDDQQQAQLDEVDLLPAAATVASAAAAKATKEDKPAKAAKGSKSKSTDASPSLNGKHAEANGADAMDVDEQEAAAAPVKKSRKSTKSKQ